MLCFNRVITDGIAFKLHSILTSILLIFFSILLLIERIFDGAIQCISQDLDRKFMNTHCWTHSTYTIGNIDPKKILGQDITYPGVGATDPGSELNYQTYYPWVGYFLFVQGIVFFIPKLLWMTLEGGKIRNLIKGLKPGKSTTELNKSKESLMAHLKVNSYSHNIWSLKYFVCEILCLINVFVQIFVTDSFLGGKFLKYGYLFLDPEVDLSVEIFPLMAKCTFFKYGASGVVQKHDILCDLKLNAINEKIFLFLWFWFIILFVILLLSVISRQITVFVPLCSGVMIWMHTGFSVPLSAINKAMLRCSVGDRFLLYMLARNLDGRIFEEVMYMLSDNQPLLVNNAETRFGA